MTLTLPHVRDQTIQGRIWVARETWKRFLRKLNRHWIERDVRSAEWFRVFEWTPGDDERGHPHFHLWVLSPYLPLAEVEEWWRQAFVEVTGDETVQRVIVHICEVSAGGAERELIKYLTKDITANGEKIAPEIYAEVYKAIDGRRATQASRGFMGKAKSQEQTCACGCVLPKRVQRVRKQKETG